MVKLIAKRPIQDMGRIYERGEPVPAYDTGMVEAWLRAGSAEWTGRKPPDAPQDAVDGGGRNPPERETAPRAASSRRRATKMTRLPGSLKW